MSLTIIKYPPANSGGTLSGAINGLSTSGTDAVLGQDVGQLNNPATLSNDREVPLNSHNVVFTGVGRIGVGTSSPALNFDVNGTLGATDRGYPTLGLGSNLPARAYITHGGSNWGLAIVRADVGNGAANLSFYKTRNTDASVRTGTLAGDNIANIGFFSPTANGSVVTNTSRMRVVVTGTPTNTYVPAFFEWGTTSNTGTYAERVRLSSDGNLHLAGLAGGAIDATAKLHIGAGTATASTAPLKFTSGVNLTTPETGAVEYNGTNLFFTRTGTTRETILTSSAVTTESVASTTTITVNVNGTNYKLLAVPA